MSKLSVKPGDKLIVTSSRYGETRRSIRTVAKCNTLFFSDTTGDRWSYDGGSYPKCDREKHTSVKIELATPELLESVKQEYKRNKLLALLRDCKWEDLCTTSLEQVQSIVEHGERYKS